ncbi:MAG: hypothetical protein ABSE47_17805, partial [Acidimicrobiales bacterium]
MSARNDARAQAPSAVRFLARILAALAVVGGIVIGSGTQPQAARAGGVSPYSSLQSASVHISSPSAGATGVSYVVTARMSNDGALVAGAGSITIVAPAGTILPSSAVVSLVGSKTPAFEWGGTVAAGGSVFVMTPPVAVPAGAGLQLKFTGVTNAPTAGSQRLEIYTSSDLQPATAPFALQGAGHSLGQVVDPTAHVTSSSAGASHIDMTLTFTIPSGGTLAVNTGDIFVVAPPGTNFTGGTASTTDASAGLLDKNTGYALDGESVMTVTSPANLAA